MAEWVENAATREVLKNIGVDFLQGSVIHQPEPLVARPDKPRPDQRVKDVSSGTLH